MSLWPHFPFLRPYVTVSMRDGELHILATGGLPRPAREVLTITSIALGALALLEFAVLGEVLPLAAAVAFGFIAFACWPWGEQDENVELLVQRTVTAYHSRHGTPS